MNSLGRIYDMDRDPSRSVDVVPFVSKLKASQPAAKPVIFNLMAPPTPRKAPMPTSAPVKGFADLLKDRAATISAIVKLNAEDPGSSSALFAENRLRDLDDEIRARFGDGPDLDFRAALTSANTAAGVALPLVRNAISDTNLRGRSFVESLFGAMAPVAPLFDLATRFLSSTGERINVGFVSEQVGPNGTVARSTTIPEDDPEFGAVLLDSYPYKNLLTVSDELLNDSALDFEGYAADRIGPLIAFNIEDDLWTGSGTNEPVGLLPSLSTVTAAGSAVVAFNDIAKLLEAVPPASRYSGRCAVVLSPGAHVDLMQEAPLYDWASGKLFNFDFRVDPALANPATTAKSAVAGDFSAAYAVRVVSLRVASSSHRKFEADQTQIKVALRVDGQPMVVDAARALVHP